MKQKQKRKRSPEVLDNALGMSVRAFLDHHGWNVGTVGPCEIRIAPDGDRSGQTLAQYEFVTKFYGCRKKADPCAEKR